jgi:hypothetical protein
VGVFSALPSLYRASIPCKQLTTAIHRANYIIIQPRLPGNVYADVCVRSSFHASVTVLYRQIPSDSQRIVHIRLPVRSLDDYMELRYN